MLVSLVSAAALTFAPHATPAEEPGTADLQVTHEVCEGEFMGAGGCPTVHVGDLVIGDSVTLVYKITNLGPEAADVTFVLDFPSDRGNAYFNPWRGQWTGWGSEGSREAEVEDCRPAGRPLTCRMPLQRRDSYWVRVVGKGNVPGVVTADATVTSSLPDPDESNNAAAFATTVVCSVYGTDADDELVGTPERESFCAGAGNDHVTAVGNGDKVFGDEGDDLIEGDSGEQVFYGGAGVDTVSYANAENRVQIFLSGGEGTDRTWTRGSAMGWGPELLIDIEQAIGSPYGDYIEGSREVNVLRGLAGNDKIVGRGGKDRLFGGRGRDAFRSKDSSRDIIRGGRGVDRSWANRFDAVISSRRVARAPFADRNPPAP